jgi:hypothetical protein
MVDQDGSEEVWAEEDAEELEEEEEFESAPDPPQPDPEPDPEPEVISKGNPRVGGRYVLDRNGNHVKVE